MRYPQNLLIIIILAGLTLGARPAASQQPEQDSTRALAYHLLSRITYGPRPGDVDRVLASGIDRFIAQQLDPESIDDWRTADAVRDLEILRTPTSALATMFREQRQAALTAQRAAGDSVMNETQRRRNQANRGTGLARLLAQYPKATVTRAVLSERQLYEVMVDFWTNHFNVYSAKGAVRYLLPEYVEQTIRPHALGNFEDLLIATAQSPAMLFYLDNIQSIAEGAEPPQLANMERQLDRARRLDTGSRNNTRRGQRNQNIRRVEEQIQRARERLPKGLNENYARELLELHTLGVDGGYTQQDVIDVARIFTGWSMGGPARREPSSFVFNAWAHDNEEKTVMGIHYAPGGGMDEGVALLRTLATHPSTIRNVSAKLCSRFVLDTPPDGCVDTAVAAWQSSNGNITAVVRAIISSDEFWASAGQKTKTPLEFVVSAVRALGGKPDTTLALPQVVRRLGQPLYGHEAPTGYPETQDDWVNAGALLERFNIALGLAAGRVPGVEIELEALVPLNGDLDEMIEAANNNILQGMASTHTLNVWRERAAELPSRDRRVFLVGLAIGSREFQKQ